MERIGGSSQNAGANQERHTFTGLSPDTDYEFRARAIGALGPSSWSNTVAARTPPAAGNGSGFADFGNRTIVISTTRGGGGTQLDLLVNNNDASPLTIWINDPTPLRRQNSNVPAGYRVPANRRQVTIPGNAQTERVTTLTFSADANAPLGAVPGELVLYTSDPRSRVVVFTIQGTVR